MTTTNHSTVTSNKAADGRSPSVRRPSLPHPHDDHNDGDENNPQTFLYVILFYKYHTLSTNRIVMEQYQTILYNLCRKLHLSGRILIGTGSCSNSEATTDNNNNNEGINGTLAGQYHDLLAFTHALLYYHRKEIPDIERTDCYPIFNEDDDDHNDENHIQQQQQQQRRRLEAMEEFWNQSAQFFTTITTTASVVAIPPSSFELRMTSPDDFKWSRVATTTTNTDTQSVLYTSNMSDINMNHNINDDDDHQDTNLTNASALPSNTSSSSSLFPDLHIKLVSELIGTGCPEFQQIPIEETSIGYLTPQEWHEHLSAIYQTTTALQESHDDPTTTTTTTKNCDSNNLNNAIIIDCRNTKEYQIGHFQDAIHPNMTTFAQFVPWVERNRILLQQKPKIYMYCTGGIRCEKASAYIRRTVPNVQQVYHLKGGIHKYLEQYGTNPTNDTPVVASTNDVGNDNINVEMGTSTTTSTITPPIWKGRNFVFDGRGSIMPSSIVNPKIHSGPSVDPDTTTNGNDVDKTVTANIVGQCAYCQSPYDQFDPHCVCTVCREPILVCPHCQTITAGTFRDPDRTLNDDDDTIRSTSTIIHEYHCGNHQHLQNCYYTNLNMFTVAELQYQLIKLKQHMATIAIGRRYKQKRKTLQKQMVRIQDRMDELHNGDSSSMIRDDPQPQENGLLNNDLPCRNCGSTDCIDGRCWGFYGLKRKERLEGSSGNVNDTALKERVESDQCGTTEEKSLNIKIIPLLQQLPAQPKLSKYTKNNKRRNDAAIDEMMQLNIAVPPSKYRDDGTGIRVPPCCTRVVQCTTKAKWYGQSVLKVIQNEFTELAKPDVLNDVVSHGLLRLNGKSISFNELPSLSLKGSDTLGRIIHWHEAPVLVPMTIDVERCIVPSVVLKEYGADSEDTGTIFICNKPSSVPTHPAGPYLFNTLTMMVEGQEGLPPQSLYPLHRTDRVTSGLTLCSTSVAVSRAFQRCLTNGNVDKMYLAKVDGHFASTGKDVQQLKNNWKYDIGFCEWSDDGKFVIVDAPIYTSDPAAGIRSINKLGKPSKSYFQHLYYDKESHTTVILCCPITGRNHQLRVHLQAIGFPIINDIQYGGRSDINPSRSCDKNAAMDAMIHVRDTASENKERRVSSLTERDVASAKKACKCCRVSDRDGISTSFTKAQLLMEGHSICLHAYRYKVCIFPPKSTKATDQLTELKFQVRAPTWTNEAYLQNVSWLATS